MEVLWDHGPATVTEARERLADDLAYNTVLTILRVLEQKGHVGHTEEGKAHRYHPLIDRKAASQTALTHLITKLFDGSPTALVSQLVDARGLSRDEIKRLRKLLDSRLKGRRER
jgi:predicted transcriptional regulator